MSRFSLLAQTALAIGLGGVLTACGGPQVPTHNGYRNANVKGWENPTAIEFDDSFEAEVDGELTYPNRRRARWFAIDLPEDGEIEVRLSFAPLGEDSQPVDDGDSDPFDVAFEVYDDRYRMLMRADNQEDDVGELSKERTLYELIQGRYLIHLYLQRRIDEAEYTLRVQFTPGMVESQTDFPKNVAFVDVLPRVPPLDDAPRTTRCRGPRCRRGSGKSTPARGTTRGRTTTSTKGVTKPPVAEASNGMRARITGVRVVSGGTRITINRGSAHGVVKGWKGRVVNRGGNPIPDGSFTITQVKANESYATVRASSDAVSSAANARLIP